MARNYSDWLQEFMRYSSNGEAPPRFYFWVGVSTFAGALRRRVWIDQAYFKWFPNFYVVLVAPPGVVSKSTSAGIGMELLRNVPGIKFGPEVVTWPALIDSFENACESFEYKDEWHVMSPLTIESSEFGNLLDPSDRGMVDMLVTLWDGKPLEKRTKTSGNNIIQNPWINLIACTTPSWIAGNFPEYMIGGGFTSRCVFVFADKKERYVAYPGLAVPEDHHERRSKLIEDLETVSITLAGEYRLTPEAIKWGQEWYQFHYENRPEHLDDERFGGYIARKQTHIHKLAIILEASQSDNLWISAETLAVANTMVTDLEADMQGVFGKIGKSELSTHADRILWYVQKRGEVPYVDVYRFVHANFPSIKEFEDVLTGCIKAGFIELVQVGQTMVLRDKSKKA